jgi:ketosteroid isomerase-like protein
MKQLTASVLLVLLVSCASTSMQSSGMQPGDAEAAIKLQNQAVSTGALGGNPSFVDSFYASDAVLLPPNAPPVRGRDAIRQLWTAMISSGTFDLKLTTENVIQSGDMATEIGRYDLVVTPKAAGVAPVHDVGKYLVSWQKVDGKWQAIADAFSSNNPPPASH